MRLLRFAAAVLVATSLPAAAQYTIGKIVFKNAGPYKQADLEAALGVHVGSKASADSLQAAAQRLIDTGYFEDVGVGLDGTSAALQFVLTLKPVAAQQLTATGFENFVWLSPEELASTLHKAAPLFHGRLPDAGNQADAINEALGAALSAKGAKAVVTHTTLEPSTSQPVRAVEFRVEQPSVRVHSISVQGVSATMAPVIQVIVTRLQGTRYNEGLAGETTQSFLLTPYTNDGYLDAKLTGVHYTTSTSAPGTVDVDMTGSIDEGAPYRVAGVNFAGTEIAPATVLTSATKLHDGDIASRKLLLETLLPVDVAYRRLGYMDVVVDPGAVLNSATHTVTYNVTVIPGEVYHVRNVNAIGLSPAARGDYDRGWLMKTGEIYNAEYVAKFLRNNTALKNLAGYTAAFKAVADPKTHLVDLTVNFVMSGRRAQ